MYNCNDFTNVFLLLGSKEAAYLSAISAASVAYAVTRACSKGELAEYCSCDTKIKKRKTQKWKWGGCSDDIRCVLFTVITLLSSRCLILQMKINRGVIIRLIMNFVQTNQNNTPFNKSRD